MTAMQAKSLPALLNDQASAAAPDIHAWVAASAGTGKTQVLSARVLRLLLQGTPPHAILCLTFTKLAAAEMKTRIFDRLAHWARCDAAELAHDLAALRAGDDAAMMDRARRLFATVLDAPQGLAIETIHAFAQGLIASFPVEAGVAPGFRTLDDRDAAALRRRLLGEAIDRADEDADTDFLADLAQVSIAGGEARLAQVVARLAGHDEALATLRREAVLPLLRRGLRLPEGGNAETALAAAMARFDADSVAHLADAFTAHGAVTAKTAAANVRLWLGADDRAAHFERLCGFFLTAKGEPRSAKAVPAAAERAEPGLCELFTGLAADVVAILAEQRLEQAVALAAAHLRIGIVVAADWRAAKARLGVIDYDDMIAAAVRLLDGGKAADWVRYKLDQRIDHVLVDEAQDTNEAQWTIVRSLAEEFFAGLGARDVQRTLFVVGDFKQAIFGFQGSDPRVYAAMKEHFAGLAKDALELWRDIPLATNFRSVPAVLTVVDAVADVLGHAALDQSGLVPPHSAHRRDMAGAVTLWPPCAPESDDAEAEAAENDEDESDGSDNDDTPARVTRAEVALAHKVAAQIAGWIHSPTPLRLPSSGKRVQPQDILVLVRSRSAFSGALVGALHQHQVPVAGVDRLKLSDPLAVADLLALVRFALQPNDDLALAGLLVSPFLDLGHDRLYTLAADRRGSLWEAVRGSTDARVVEAQDWLSELLGFADFAAPYAFLERILSGPLKGRQRLLDRLGEEARDAIDAVLDQALAFEALQAPSLQGFLAFVDDDSIEIKRDPEAPLAAVRLMTVHGAKGLQAPVVILADATKPRNPERSAPLMMSFDNGPPLPIFLKSRTGFDGRLGEAIAAAETDDIREHCRLLYVALTRAEDLLFITGPVGANGKVPEGSWYSTVEAAMAELGAEAVEVPGMDGSGLYYTSGDPALPVDDATRITPDPVLHLPPWIETPAPQESRPPRPLSPSAIAADGVAAPPASPEMRAAARRGTALHALFERLPEIAPDRRRAVGEAFVAGGFPDLDARALVTTVLGILDDPRFAPVFAPGALTEAPVAAVVGDIVIAGSVDRLLVGADEVLVVDFKTGRRVPADAAAVDIYHLKQMAAYVAALGRVFPDRPVRAALLYTEGPALITLPDAMLALHAPKAELSLSDGGAAPILPA